MTNQFNYPSVEIKRILNAIFTKRFHNEAKRYIFVSKSELISIGERGFQAHSKKCSWKPPIDPFQPFRLTHVAALAAARYRLGNSPKHL